MPAPLHIVQRTASGVVIYEVHGRLVLDDGDEVLRDRVASLIKDGPLALLVDLRNVSYIDSAGVGVLVEAYLRFVRRGGQLKVLMPSEHVRRVLHITRLDTVLEIFEDESTALRTFDRVNA